MEELHDACGSWGIEKHCHPDDKTFNDWIDNQDLWTWHRHGGMSEHLCEQKYHLRSAGEKVWKQY